jgi:hypothetical protein
MLRDVMNQAWLPPSAKQTVAGRLAPAIRVREIAAHDLDEVAALLGRGFKRPSGYYAYALTQLLQHPTPAGCPKFGYLLETQERVVGAILLIFSEFGNAERSQLRCNVTSWYVEPEYKGYAALFASRAFQRKDVTYINISARPVARPIIKAQGFAQYSGGQFVALPALRLTCDVPAKVISIDTEPGVGFDLHDRNLLIAHAKFGCTSMWCVTAERAYPFVFLPRMFKRWMPGAQLIYCRDVNDVVRFAKPIGRYLASRGLFLVCIDANGPIPGMIGTYLEGKSPRFFRGRACPRIGDLAYTQMAMFPWPELPHRRAGQVSANFPGCGSAAAVNPFDSVIAPRRHHGRQHL